MYSIGNSVAVLDENGSPGRNGTNGTAAGSDDRDAKNRIGRKAITGSGKIRIKSKIKIMKRSKSRIKIKNMTRRPASLSLS